jgi:hypothetical protein
MKIICNLYPLFFVMLLFGTLQGQSVSKEYEPSMDYPYGRLNPNAAIQIADYKEMIGSCECRSTRRNADQSWQDPLDMIWEFKYILNGTAVQDEVWRENELYATSIRQYQADSARWVVTYFSYPAVSTSPGIWQGNRLEEEIVLKMPQKAPNGMAGFSQLTFYDISNEGFKWKGEWVDKSNTVVFPFWKIDCKKKLMP